MPIKKKFTFHKEITFGFFIIRIFFSCSLYAQSIFSNSIIGNNPNTANPFTSGQTADNNITVSGISRSAGLTGKNANDRYNAQSWSNSNVIQNSKYFEFTLSPINGFKINFSNFTFHGSTSSDGPTNLILKSSLDNFTNSIASPSIGGDMIDLSSSTFQNINASITFRIYGYNAVSNLGTFSIDDFAFNGEVIPINLIAPVITSSLATNAVINLPSNSYSIKANNYPSRYNATNLPPGLSINQQTGMISGVPSSASGSPYSVTISASNAAGTNFATLIYTIELQTCSNAEYINYSFGTNTTSQQNPNLISSSNVSVSNISRNNVFGSVNPLIENASVSNGYANASGNFNATASCMAGTFGNASTYFEFTITNSLDYASTINKISFGSRSTNTGPINFLIRSSADNYNSNIASGSLVNNSTWSLQSNSNLAISCAYGNTVTFRIYGYGATGGTSLSNWRIDDLNVQFDLNRKPPAIYNLTASSTTYCVGSSGISIGLNNSQIGVNYQLLLNNSALIGNPISGTGSAISFGNQTVAGTYYVNASYQNTSCISSMGNPITININYVNTWIGTFSNNWSDAQNWSCGALPNINTTEIIIPANTTYLPLLDVDLAIYGDLNLLNNQSTLSINGKTLTLYGKIKGQGYLTGSAQSNLSIEEGTNETFSLRMNQNTSDSYTLGNLFFNRNANLILSTPLKITEKVNIICTNGIIESNGNLTLVSSRNSIAEIGYLSNNANVSGLVNVQCFFTGGNSQTARGTRMLSFPVKDDANAPKYIFDQIKEKVFFTGPGNTSNNFDLGGLAALNATTMVTYDESKLENEYGFNLIPNLLTRTIPAKGYFMFYRGNRINNAFNKLNQPFANPEDVVINYCGLINKGDILLPVTNSSNNNDNYNGYNAIGNPYPATIDINAFLNDNQDKLENIISIIKPDRSGQVTMSNGISTNNNGMDIRFIQPGQAFYVRVKNGKSGNVIFKESQKQSNANTARLLYNPIKNNTPFKNIANKNVLKVKVSNEISSNECSLVFDDNYSFNYDHADAINFSGSILTCASLSNEGIPLSINFMHQIIQTDTIKLLINSQQSDANLTLNFRNLEDFTDYDIFLQDKFSEKIIPLNGIENQYQFGIDKNVNTSFGANRMQLILKKKETLPVQSIILKYKKNRFQNLLEWETFKTKNAIEFEILKSKDGDNFTTLNSLKAKSLTSCYAYKLTDDISDVYLKIKQIDFDNSEIFSNIIYLHSQNKNDWEIFPNPVKNNLYIFKENIDISQFQVNLYDFKGNLIFTKPLQYNFNLEELQSGVYNLIIVEKRDKKTLLNKIIIKD